MTQKTIIKNGKRVNVEIGRFEGFGVLDVNRDGTLRLVLQCPARDLRGVTGGIIAGKHYKIIGQPKVNKYVPSLTDLTVLKE